MADNDDFMFSDDEEEEVIDPMTLGPELYSLVKENLSEKALEYIEMGVPVDSMEDFESDNENNNNNGGGGNSDEKSGSSPCSWTMLHWAAHHGNVDLVDALLRYGANNSYKEAKIGLKLRTEGGIGREDEVIDWGTPAILLNTPLHKAAFKGHLRCVWLLLRAGYSVDDLDSVGNTPLHLAATSSRTDVLNCLIDHTADVRRMNNFKNLPISLCTSQACRGLLKAAASKPVLTPEQREVAMQDHLDAMVEKEEELESIQAKAGDSNELNIEDIEEKIQTGLRFGISAEVAEASLALVKELKLERKLKTQIQELVAHKPIITQSLFCEYVNKLKDTIVQVNELLKANPSASATSASLTSCRKTAEELCSTSHSEFWLRVAMDKVVGVECAGESTVKLMDKLKESISRAEVNEADETLLKGGKELHKRLTVELEVKRAAESFPTVKLPVNTEEMTAKEIKEYWAEEDPDNPVNIGKIEETREWPLPPEDTGEYIWIPSESYKLLKSAVDRLSAGISAGKESAANAALLEESAKVLEGKMVEMSLMEEKNGEDKAQAIAVADKMAKKLKKKKGKK